MARSTVYNADLVTPEDWAKVEPKNIELLEDFINYCVSVDRSPQTIKQYEAQLKIFFVWNLKYNKNKFFVDLKKRELMNFFGSGRLKYGWSPNRLSSFRAVLSSMSNFIERILDDEYPTFRNIVKVLEPVHIETVREKTIIDEEDIQKALDMLVEAKEYQMATWLGISFASGMRKSEVIQMKVSFFKPEALVFGGIAYATPKIRTKGRGTKGKQVQRYVFVEYFQKYFQLWMKQREELQIQSDYLFVVKHNGTYEPATNSTINSWARRVGELMRIDLYAHSLRHAQVSYLKRKKISSEVLQALQSWSSTDLVRLYDDSTNEDLLSEAFANSDFGATDKVNTENLDE